MPAGMGRITGVTSGFSRPSNNVIRDGEFAMNNAALQPSFFLFFWPRTGRTTCIPHRVSRQLELQVSCPPKLAMNSLHLFLYGECIFSNALQVKWATPHYGTYKLQSWVFSLLIPFVSFLFWHCPQDLLLGLVMSFHCYLYGNVDKFLLLGLSTSFPFWCCPKVHTDRTVHIFFFSLLVQSMRWPWTCYVVEWFSLSSYALSSINLLPALGLNLMPLHAHFRIPARFSSSIIFSEFSTYHLTSQQACG